MVDQSVAGEYDEVSYDLSVTLVLRGKETEEMSSLPSHHGFFFLDAFVSTSFLVALYHSIRSLLLPDIIPHLGRVIN